MDLAICIIIFIQIYILNNSYLNAIINALKSCSSRKQHECTFIKIKKISKQTLIMEKNYALYTK